MRYARISEMSLIAAFGAVLMLSSMNAVFAQPEPQSEPTRTTSAPGNYKIGAGDVIDVTLDNNDTLSRRAIRVSNQGTIQLAMIDSDVVAACRTERELADQIRDRYKKYLLNPHVTVAVKEFNSNPVAVIGAVNGPGRFQLQRPVRLLE
ncbi:MAG TPA: polysaccharide biosynthesis/export family protein, partial [Pyrinomonadaceae bacterium]|nr:polysaccharide biosynthesis/export family protein [Pyrinomonadaceae bacterium]